VAISRTFEENQPKPPSVIRTSIAALILASWSKTNSASSRQEDEHRGTEMRYPAREKSMGEV